MKCTHVLLVFFACIAQMGTYCRWPCYIESVPNRNSPPAILLRESWREGRKVRKRTIANLSKWPPHLVEGLRVLLRGGHAVERDAQAPDGPDFEIVRSRPHGHVAAVLGTLHKLGLDRLIDARPSRQRTLVPGHDRGPHPRTALQTGDRVRPPVR